MDPELMLEILKRANQELRNGTRRSTIDRVLKVQLGMGLSTLSRTVRESMDPPKTLEQQEAETAITHSDTFRALGYGLTLGFLDELDGAISALTQLPDADSWSDVRKKYEEARDTTRKEIEDFRKEHPAIAGLLSTAGAAGPAALALAGAPGALGFPSGPGGSLMTGTAAGAATGAVAGAGGMLGEDEGPGRIPGAAGGALLGGAAGAAAGAAGPLAVPAARAAPALGRTAGRAGMGGLGAYGLYRLFTGR